MKRTTYIYAIQNDVNGKVYIGRSMNPENRFYSHMLKLQNGNHSSKIMQSDYNKYGEKFSLYILESVDADERVHNHGRIKQLSCMKEVEWMEEYKTYCDEYGYNGQDNAAKVLKAKRNTYHTPIKQGKPKPLWED